MELAAEFGRTDTAIRSRCHMLLPPQRRAERNSKLLAVELLGLELHNDPGYDWEQQLRDRAAAAGELYWSEAMDDSLLEGWQRGASWEELVTATGATEREMAQRLKRRGLVASQQEILDRIGNSSAAVWNWPASATATNVCSASHPRFHPISTTVGCVWCGAGLFDRMFCAW
jgi:hypothetical protein